MLLKSRCKAADCKHTGLRNIFYGKVCLLKTLKTLYMYYILVNYENMIECIPHKNKRFRITSFNGIFYYRDIHLC